MFGIREMIRSMFRNAVIAYGPEGIREGAALVLRDLANLGAEDAAKAQAMLARLGVDGPALPIVQPFVPAELPAAQQVVSQVTPPQIQAAPPIQLATSNDNNKPDLRNGPGRPRKIHVEGGRP